MAGHAEPGLDDHLWTIAAARLLLPESVSLQAPPNLSYDDFPRLLDAGIDDWGGVSPVTIDHVNPEAPWPDRDRLAEGTRSRGLELAPRLPVYPGYLSGAWLDPAVLPQALRRSDALGLAREDGWHPGEPGAIPFTVSRDPLPVDALRLTGDELGEEELVRLFRARGEERQRVLAAADRLRREVCGDEVSYVVTRNIQYTNVCYFRCGFCAFSKGKLAANLRGAPYLVPHEEIVRRAEEAWARGRDRGLPPGRDPPGLHRRLLRERRRGDPRRRPRDPHPRLLGARDLAGRRHAGAAAGAVPRAAARPRARLAPRHRRRDPRRRGAGDHLPRQGHDRPVARRARGRARGRAPLERDDDARPRRAAEALGAAPDPGPRAAGAVGRLHRVRAAPVRAHGGADVAEGPRPLRARRSGRRC